MSWRSGCQICSLLRSHKLPTAGSTSRLAPTSGTSSQYPSRSLASRPAASAQRDATADRDSHGTRQRGFDKHAEAPVSSIYPNSKAADRRNPHAPPLFNHFKRRAAEQSSSKASGQRSSRDAYILRNISTDPELKQLYTSLGRAADTDDAVLATKLCQLIKERKQQMAGPSETIVFEPEEKVVFLAIMRTLAHHGLLEEVQAVHADMLSFGFEDCVDSLNHILQAAIISGDEHATSTTLDSIFALSGSSVSESDRSKELADILLNDSESIDRRGPANAAGRILPAQRMRNWNATTFAHMVDSACQEHNLEYALLLLSSCYRMRLALPHDTLVRLIKSCIHNEEFRTAVELADLTEEGGLAPRQSSTQGTELRIRSKSIGSVSQTGQVARRFPPSIWMLLLRSCAEGGYLPGVELAWSKAVTQGLLFPDDGLLHLILALAAKEGSVQLAHVCLRHVDPTFNLQEFSSSGPTASIPSGDQRSTRRPAAPSRGKTIEEWHLSPLFEAYCTARDFEGAMRVMREYHCRGFEITERTTSRISTSIYPDKASLQLARDSLDRFATNATIGTHKAVVNAVLTAAVWLGDLTQALEIYKAMPTYYPYAVQEGAAPRRNVRGRITPNLDTIHALLSGCIDAADYETGVDLLKDLNAHRMKPTEVTFERMIVLCLTQSNYDDAFGFIEEAKQKDILPSRKSYEALVRKCFREKDHRWESVLADMSEQGYRPSPKLLHELEIEPGSFEHKPRRPRP